MKSAFDCGVTESLLGSARMLSHMSHCAALIAAAGVILTHAVAGRWMFVASLGCWPVTGYFGVRVAIDAALFRTLAGSPEEGGEALDRWLRDYLHRQPKSDRALPDRIRGAVQLWKRLVAVVVLQVAVLCAALVVQALVA